MSERVHPFVDEWLSKKPASASAIDQIEEALGVELPPSYKAFLSQHGSGEAVLQDGSVILYPPDDLLAMHGEPTSGFSVANLLLFGGNAGGEAFAFDLRTRPCRFVMVPFISNYQNDRLELGDQIDDLFDYPRRLGTSIA